MSQEEKDVYLRLKEEQRIAELQKRRELKMKEREEEREKQRQERLIQIALERVRCRDLNSFFCSETLFHQQLFTCYSKLLRGNK